MDLDKEPLWNGNAVKQADTQIELGLEGNFKCHYYPLLVSLLSDATFIFPIALAVL